MSAKREAPGALAERGELAALREQAARTRQEVGVTITALAGKVARDERQWGRRAALYGPPAGLAALAAFLLYRRHRS
jgi:hypothetical protein